MIEISVTCHAGALSLRRFLIKYTCIHRHRHKTLEGYKGTLNCRESVLPSSRLIAEVFVIVLPVMAISDSPLVTVRTNSSRRLHKY